jgi:hypothetical protein
MVGDIIADSRATSPGIRIRRWLLLGCKPCTFRAPCQNGLVDRGYFLIGVARCHGDAT